MHGALLKKELGVSSMGEPLDAAVRAPFERSFDRSFADVRVHRDDSAARAAASLAAHAFTLGRHIVFGRNAYAPSTGSGRRLIAHELTHVAQHDSKGHAATGGAAVIHRQLYAPPVVPPLLRLYACLQGLYPPMVNATFGFVEASCARGSQSVPSNHYDAFGHCWIACEGSRRCGRLGTRAFGIGREWMREYTPLGGPHDSYEQDLQNQARGRDLSESRLSCAVACDQALHSGSLDLSAPAPDCFDCATGRYQRPCGS